MLLAFVVAGRGIGASGAMTRFVAWIQHGLFPEATEQSAYSGSYFADGAHPLNDYLVFLVVGLITSRFVAASASPSARGAASRANTSAKRCSIGRLM